MQPTINYKDIHSFSVDIVIPVRAREEYDLVSRLEFRAKYNLPLNFNFLVVDYGSKFPENLAIQSACEKHGFKYIFSDTSSELWNASEARNIALLSSNADYIIFEDLDLISHTDFYYWIANQIESLIIKRNWPFFVVPVSYLTESASEHIDSPLSDKEYDDLTSEIFNANDSEIISFHAPVSSYLICSRQHALFVGGYDNSFEGWGFEDSDFWLRLLKKSNIDYPREFYKLDTRPYSNQVQWRGWRALFRIFGDLLSNKGIYSFHKWHPIAEHRSPEIREKNHKIFLENTMRYASEKYELSPLWNPNKKTHLFISKNPHSYNHSIFKFFENPLLIEEKDISILFIGKLIKKYNIEAVIFNNPYGNPKRLAIYQTFKKHNIPCYVVERGALPWSIYIDEDGFCAESSSYLENNWPQTITEENRLKTIEYINNLRVTGSSLEPQSSLIGGDNLKRKLFGDSKNTKILFIALQSPSDTTTNFFCGKIKSYSNFINEIKQLPFLLDESEWKVIYKNHPLTIEKIKLDNATCVDDYHIGDILDACDSVALINSGVGVLAAAYCKPVYTFGQVFYRCDGLNKSVENADDLANNLLYESFSFDKEKSIRFISFLINDFYSFAKWTRKERKHTNQANLSISENIEYDIIRIRNKGNILINNSKPINLKNSILFDRYRLDDYLERTNSSKKVEWASSSGTKPVNSQNKSTIAQKPESKVITEQRFADKSSISQLDLNRNIQKEIIKNKANSPKNLNSFKRKFYKLIHKPKLFFADFFLKRIN